MRSLIIAALIAIPALAGAASADEGRMNRTEFDRAARCLAYADLAVLQSDRPDTAALDARFAAEIARRPANTRNEVKQMAREVRVTATAANTPGQIERLKADRDRACTAFLDAPVSAKTDGSAQRLEE